MEEQHIFITILSCIGTCSASMLVFVCLQMPALIKISEKEEVDYITEDNLVNEEMMIEREILEDKAAYYSGIIQWL